jgi:hypothetical protein
MMTWEERVRAVTDHGFTPRQAGFLVTVMLHAGVCLGRQYCTFAHIAYGQVMHDFFHKLVADGCATARRFRQNNARLYHVHHKPLYEDIGDPDNRHRKTTTLARAVEKLMVLDAVLATRDRLEWLATEREKVAYFTLTRQIPQTTLPAVTFRGTCGETVRHFVDKFPIGLAPDGRHHVFVYLASRPLPMEFRLFLERHAELLRKLPEWTVRLLIPRHLQSARLRYEQAFREQVGTPLRRPVIEELTWFFQTRRAGGRQSDTRFEQARHAFASPRFRALHRTWLERGDVVLDATISPTLADALARRTGRLECHVLPHAYLQLSSLVGTA